MTPSTLNADQVQKANGSPTPAKDGKRDLGPGQQTEPADALVQSIVNFFETLTPASAAQCGLFYDANARFKDPFNDVTGLQMVMGIYEHMYVALHEPRFVVTGRIVQGTQCVLLWDFVFRFKRFDTQTVQTVHGSSHLVLNSDGKIVLHRDYWDVAEELYEKLPVVGSLMRWLKKRANS